MGEADVHHDQAREHQQGQNSRQLEQEAEQDDDEADIMRMGKQAPRLRQQMLRERRGKKSGCSS